MQFLNRNFIDYNGMPWKVGKCIYYAWYSDSSPNIFSSWQLNPQMRAPHTKGVTCLHLSSPTAPPTGGIFFWVTVNGLRKECLLGIMFPKRFPK